MGQVPPNRVLGLTITELAQAHFQKLLADQPEGTQIRVYVSYPGTVQAECGVAYCPSTAITADDQLLPFNGFSAVINASSFSFLQEAVIDFANEALGTQLTIKAPHAKLAKVAEDAPLFERVNYFLESTVNPQLAAHGGRVSLIEMTDAGRVILQFGGGCNGCAMVDVTLKEGIEKELLAHFPELTGVQDVTEHQAGEHSYY
ncbi:MAG: Fe-S biogenesis protein NfuA [Candidatus Symbiodolus clandestinus]